MYHIAAAWFVSWFILTTLFECISYMFGLMPVKKWSGRGLF